VFSREKIRHQFLDSTSLPLAHSPLKKGEPINGIVFEHVPVTDLPAEWRAKLAQAPGATVTVRIEADDQDGANAYADDPLFGMWRDREDMADVAGSVRGIRADRFSDDSAAMD
jgi:hypothetical protein